MTVGVPTVICLSCWSDGIINAHRGWMCPCSHPIEFHGLSILMSACMSCLDSIVQNLAWNLSLTARWSAHSYRCSWVSPGWLHLAHRTSSGRSYTFGYQASCRASVGRGIP